MQPVHICVVGSLNRDLVIQTPMLPQPGQTVLGGPYATFPGGKGANQAVAAARAGAQVTMVGCVGNDSYGEMLRVGLAAEGIDASSVQVREGVATGVALITISADGQNTIVVAPGANYALTPEDVQQAAATITMADMLLLQLEVPLPVVIAAANIARQAETCVILNPAPAQILPDALLSVVDILIPNETEATALTGVQVTDWASATEAARALHGRGGPSVVITLGQLGALLLHEDTIYQQAAYPVATIDPTAAGDAFVGAFAVALGAGHDLPTAMRWGAAAGALATTCLGAQPALPLHTAIRALVES